MLNRCSSAEAFVPSMVYFDGMEGSGQKQYAWDWENCSSHSPNTTFPSTNNNLQNHAFFPSASFLDCPPPLLPANSFPSFYAPPAVAEYPTGLLKREDGIGRIGLNLGRRTYFSCGDALAIDQLFARSRGLHSWSSHSPRCQAEACKADLSGAKHYHRRHKVCEFHSKATVVILGGLQQRFCQQCSRFHVLAEFDEAKRSCRKRLADHNRRRRKPQLPTTTDSSAYKNTNINSSSEKAKQAPKTTRDHSIGTKSTGNIFCTTNASTKVSVEGQQYQKKGNLLRYGPALSLGGVDASEKSGTGTNTLMYQVQGPFVTVADEEQVSQQQQQHGSSSPSASNGTLYFHHHLFCSSSHEPSQCSGGGSGRSTSDHHQSNNLHVPPRAGFV